MKLTLEIWRQAGPNTEGHFETVQVPDAVEQMSILELLDHVNEGMIEAGKEPFAFASDCREGICGTCGLNVNGRPHGADKNKPACQQRLVSYNDGDTLKIEPLRSAAFLSSRTWSSTAPPWTASCSRVATSPLTLVPLQMQTPCT